MVCDDISINILLYLHCLKYFPSQIIYRRRSRRRGQAVDAQRGLRGSAQLGRGTRPFVLRRGRVPKGHLGPGGGASRWHRRLRGRATLQRSTDLGTQRPGSHLLVVPSDGWLHGTRRV